MFAKLQAKTNIYDNLVDLLGVDSDEAKDASQEVRKIYQEYIDITNEETDSYADFLDSRNSDLRKKLSINSDKQQMLENEESNMAAESERLIGIAKLTDEAIGIQAQIVETDKEILAKMTAAFGEESAEYLEAKKNLTSDQKDYEVALNNRLKSRSETTNFINDQKSEYLKFLAEYGEKFHDIGYSDNDIENFAYKSTGFKSEWLGMTPEAIMSSIDQAKSAGKTIGEALSDGIQNGASNSVPLITWVSDDNTWSARGGRILESVASGLEDNKLTLSDEIVDIVTGAYLKAADIISNSDEYQPVIRPVVDLSNVSALGDAMALYDVSINPYTSRQLAAGISYTGPDNGVVYDDSRVIEAINGLRSDVETLEGVVGNLQIVMDSGAVVGQIAPAMDKQLGLMASYKERGI